MTPVDLLGPEILESFIYNNNYDDDLVLYLINVKDEFVH